MGARGLHDDAAVIEIGEEALVLTHDAMVEGVHFRPDADMAFEEPISSGSVRPKGAGRSGTGMGRGVPKMTSHQKLSTFKS